MSTSVAKTAPRYIAEVCNSQEVTLFGTADLAFWQRKLQLENLLPVDRNGRAQLMISAVSSRWLGARFSEFMIAVLAEPRGHVPDAGDSPGMFLLTAYNTSRPFTFIEQRYFQTPYKHGSIAVQSSPQPSLLLKQRAVELVQAKRVDQSHAVSNIEEVWEGKIYLPPRTSNARFPGNLFYARLSGLSQVSPFTAGKDVLQLTSSESEPVLGWLLESEFSGTEWHVRNSATHARSKTYPRD